MKGKVPRRVPREFPFVRHRHHALVIKMAPLRVASVFTLLWRRESGVTFKPLVHDVMIKLFVPKHSRECLALNCAMFPAQARGRERGVKFVGFMRALCKHTIEVRERVERFLALGDSLQP